MEQKLNKFRKLPISLNLTPTPLSTYISLTHFFYKNILNKNLEPNFWPYLKNILIGLKLPKLTLISKSKCSHENFSRLRVEKIPDDKHIFGEYI